MNPVVHFEIPFDDARRAAKFYQAAFGWQTKDLGEAMGQARRLEVHWNFPHPVTRRSGRSRSATSQPWAACSGAV